MAKPRELRRLDVPVIPLAGVALVIVMVLMVAQKVFTHEETRIDVPMAHTMQRQTEDNVTIGVIEDPQTKLKEYVYNDEKLPLDQLYLKLRDTLNKSEMGLLVVIRADSTSPSEWVMELLSKAKDAGAQRVAISTKRFAAETEAADGT